MNAPAQLVPDAATPVEHDPFAGEQLARVVPTTEAQREMWLADQLDPDASLAYNESVSLHVTGRLDLTAFDNAVQALTQRHDMLRTTLSGDGLRLMIAQRTELTVTVIDLSLAVPDQRLAEQARLRVEAVTTPFDLGKGPLFFITAVLLDETHTELILTAHHLVCDGWSFSVLAQELMQLYSGFAGNSEIALPPSESFADYALAEREAAHDASAEVDRRYWLAQYDGTIPLLDLPTDRARPSRRTFRSRRIDLALDATLVAAIRQRGARQNASLFATMFSLFAGLLGRLAGHDEVVVGMLVAGQVATNKPTLVGHCVNLLPVRLGTDPDITIDQLISAAASQVLDACEHQLCTFGSILKKLQTARDPSRSPLISVLFNIDTAVSNDALSCGGLDVTLRSNPRQFENFELFLNISQSGGTLLLELQYNADLFDADTVQRWLQLYRSGLERVVAVPALSVADAFAPTTADLALLDRFNQTRVEFPEHERVEILITRQAISTPEAIALTTADTQLSYRTLEFRANGVATALRERGVMPGSLVGLACGRNEHMLVALLGILKAGAGYVPLDPAFPADRLSFMANDAALAVIVSDHSVTSEWHFGTAQRLDADAIRGADTAPPLDASATDVAYVIYTSGSTGQPKGVQVPHRTVVNFLGSMRRQPGITTGDRLVAVTTLSFDIAVLELLLPLTVGAEVILASVDQVRDSNALAALLADHDATMMQATPGTWRGLLDCGWKGPPGFKAVVGGEALSRELAHQLQRATTQLWNMYGPTETTVWSTLHRVTQTDLAIPIGRPISNTEIQVVDQHLRVLPIGVAGEIIIGGAGVALGYLNRPELTAARFVERPDGDGSRWYKTGDIGRWRASGELEYLGRSDHQVKVRGYRIELGEIESVLTRHTSVAVALATTREDVPGDVRLVAYVIPAPGTNIDATTLREFARSAMPEYMIPQHVIALENFPLLPNGKINRGALPAPHCSETVVEQQEPASSPIESCLLELMQQVLHLPGIGVRDNFFALGGHSLLAARFASSIGKAFDRHVPLRVIFEAPSVVQLAAWIMASADSGNAGHQVIPRRADRAVAPLSLMQQRIWLLEQMHPGRAAGNTPSAHRLRGKFDEVAFRSAFAEMMRRQDILRTAVTVIEQTPMQMILPNLTYPLAPVEDLSAMPDHTDQLATRLQALAETPLHLSEAPLFRAALFKLGDDEHVFYFSPHHIIWDGWSFDIFYTEMAALYHAFHTDTACTLPAPAISYGDFAAWHRDSLQDAAHLPELAWWQQRLAAPLAVLALPADRPRPTELSGRCDTSNIAIRSDTRQALSDMARRHDTTLFVALLAAYALTLHKTTGQTDIVIGVPVRGRPFETLDNVMGMFVNALPVRLSIDPLGSFDILLQSVRDCVVDAFGHPDMPFEELVRALNIPRERNRAPIYQALFSFQDGRAREQSWSDLAHDMVPVLQPGLTEDLSLWLLDRPDGIIGGLGYSRDILDPDSAALLRQRFEEMIETVLAQHAVPLTQLPGSASEQRQLMKWNATTCSWPGAQLVHVLIEDQSARTPGRIALTHGTRTLTYCQLDEHSSRIAAALREQGIGRGHVVGICLERGINLSIAQLAILKSGAAYLPLDPGYPADRLDFMAADAEIAACVTEPALAGLLARPPACVILLDHDGNPSAHGFAEKPATPSDITGADIAYVIYTSGSTGQPKGVLVQHRAVVNFLNSMQLTPGMSASDKLLAVTTLSFDIAVLELLLPLTVGAETVIASNAEIANPHALAMLLHSSKATVMQATPGAWRGLLDAGWQGPPGFKALIGGEALAPDLAARLLSATAQVWNMYGPTETTVWSTCWRVTDANAAIRIGRPIANTVVRVLDQNRRECPIGSRGTLWIGGDSVAAGYLNRPELTAERFIADPFSSNRGARLYCTGDQGRWCANGLLEHLGRDDFQVKVRGYRIELGEIEASLNSHSQVADSIVTVREDSVGDARLVAYFIARDDTLSASALREHVGCKLPHYMVPQHFVRLAALPRLLNGKVDRTALPRPASKPDLMGSASGVDAQLNGPTEQLLAEVWCELLQLDAVRPEDNFFDLGGHSLLAMRVVLAMETRTGKRLNPARLIFESLRQLARAYDQVTVDAPKPGIVNRLLSGLLGKRSS